MIVTISWQLAPFRSAFSSLVFWIQRVPATDCTPTKSFYVALLCNISTLISINRIKEQHSFQQRVD